MAIEKEIKIKVDTKGAEKSVNKLEDSYDDLVKKLEEVEKAINETTDPKKLELYKKEQKKLNEELGRTSEANKKIDKTAKGAGKSSGLLRKGIKGIGLALKAAGIGIALAVFAKFVEILTRNQKVADGLSVVFKTLGNVFSSVVTAVTDAVSVVSQATGGFESLGNVLSGLLTLGLTPIKLTFFAIKLALQEAQLAWEQSLFGDDDPETVKRLNESIKETKLNLVQVGMDAVKAGKDVADNFSGAIDELGALANEGINNLSKVSLKASFEQAKTSTELGKAALIAEAQLQGLIEKYDRQAEQLRQIRDDDRKSISERIKANDELGKVLEEQAKEQKKLAGIRVSAAAQELSLNKGNVEAKKELIEAQNEVAAIEAQIEGFRSEQLVNRNSLLKEQKEILKELNKIGKDELELAKQEALAERDARLAQIELQVEDEKKKFELLAAARKEYDDTIAELDNAAAEKERERQDQIDAILKERIAKEIEDQFEKARAELEAQKIADIEKLKQAKATEEEINRIKKIFKKKADEINEDEANFKEELRKKDIAQAANASSQVLSSVTELVGKGSKAGKAAAIANATIDTIGSAIGAYNSVVKTPFVGPVLAPIAAGVATAAGLKSIKEIVKVKTPGGGSAGSVPNISTPNQSETQAPAFNLTASSGVNQLASDVEGVAPVRAFVVGSDVTNQQQMDRDTFGQAGL